MTKNVTLIWSHVYSVFLRIIVSQVMNEEGKTARTQVITTSQTINADKINRFEVLNLQQIKFSDNELQS